MGYQRERCVEFDVRVDAAIDHALNKKGKLRVRVPTATRRRFLEGEMEPYDVDAFGGKRYVVKARISNTTWRVAA